MLKASDLQSFTFDKTTVDIQKPEENLNGMNWIKALGGKSFEEDKFNELTSSDKSRSYYHDNR